MKFPPSVSSDPNVSHMAVRVLITMWRWLGNQDEPYCYASQALIADNARVLRQNMTRYLNELINAGYIKSEGPHRPDQPKSPIRYRLLYESELTGEVDTEEAIPSAQLEALPPMPPPEACSEASYASTGGMHASTGGMSNKKEALREKEEETTGTTYPPSPVSSPPSGVQTHMSEAPTEADPEVDEAWDYYRAKIQARAMVCDRQMIKRRLKTFGLERLKQAMDNFHDNPWQMEHNSHRGAGWWFKSDTRIESYINLQPKRKRPSFEERHGTSETLKTDHIEAERKAGRNPSW